MKNEKFVYAISGFILLILLVSGCIQNGIIEKRTNVKPPEQPSSGPGGANYSHNNVSEYVYGEGSDQYWIFEPANPKPKFAPIIVFNHGWGVVIPDTYRAWINHIVKRGNIVIYPRYQTDLNTPGSEFTPNAIQAVKDAINRLQNESENHVRPELDKFAIVGHSAGGVISAQMAALAKENGLPEPKAVMCVEPGRESLDKSIKLGIPYEDLTKIPKYTLLLIVVADRDSTVGKVEGKRIFKDTPQIPTSSKNFIVMVSDVHGDPDLIANHSAPVAIEDKNGKFYYVDALDYYGFWKLFDALCDAAFYNKNREYALGNTPQQRFMGKWSDGTPVKELKVYTDYYTIEKTVSDF